MKRVTYEKSEYSCLMTKEVYDYYCLKDENAIKQSVDISDSTSCLNSNIDNEEPLISVVIPTHNRVTMLQRALDSLLCQEYASLQIVVIDDYSSDQTYDIIQERYSCRGIEIYRNETNMNAGLSRKRGFSHAKGEYIVFMDDDDYYVDKYFFRKAVKIHKQYRSLAFVSANSFIEDTASGGLICSMLNRTGFLDGQTYISCFQTAIKKPNSTFTSVFNKSILNQLGFDSMHMMNDSSIYLRSLLLGDAYFMRDLIGTYVVHGSNISTNLSVDFIIQNLKEKKFVYDFAVETKARELKIEWLSNQMWVTLKYYLLGNAVNFTDLFALTRWMSENKIPAEHCLLLFAHYLSGRAHRFLHTCMTHMRHGATS